MSTKRKPSRRVVAIVGDIHVGGTTALWPKAGYTLEDGQRITPNKVQGWLYEQWTSFWRDVKGVADGAPIIGIVNGEYIDGNHHGTTQIMTPSVQIQRDASAQLFTAPRAMCAEWYSIRGTAAHVGQGGQDDDAVAAVLESVRDPNTGRSSFYELSLDVGGVLIDVAHHISSTMRAWTRGNNIRAEILSVALDRMNARLPARLPDLIIRSHVHSHIDTHDEHMIRGIVLPAWQYKTQYVSRLTRARRFTVGGLIVSIEDRQRWDANLWLRTLEPPEPMRSKV